MNAGTHSSTTSRNGVNSRQSTCLECSTPTSPTWNPHEGRKQSWSSCGCPPSLRIQPNKRCFAPQVSSTVKRHSDSGNFKIPSTNSARHDAHVLDLSCSTGSNSQARARKYRRNPERLCRLLKTGSRNPSDVTVLHGRHSFDLNPPTTGKTPTFS